MTARAAGIVAALALTGLIAYGASGRGIAAPPGSRLVIAARTTTGTFAQIFWNRGNGFREADSQAIPLEHSTDGFQRLSFEVPPGRLQGVWFDPLNAPGTVTVASVELIDASGRLLRDLGPRSLTPSSDIATMLGGPGGLTITTTPGGSDPRLWLSPACLMAPPPWYSATLVTPIALALTSAAVLALILGASWMAIRGGRENAPPAHGRRAVSVLWLASLYAVVVGAKLWLIHAHPSQVPFVDQWPAEAGLLYLPWHDGCLPWQQMTALHNEHRILFTRLLALDLFTLNRQWDPQLQQVVNALLHALVAVVLAAAAWLALGRRHLDLIVLATAVAFALPFGYENTLGGFQSAFYFTVLFSVLGLLLTMHPPGSVAWKAGLICVACAMLSSAGGLVTPVAIAGGRVVDVLVQRTRRAVAPADAVMIAVTFAFGFLLRAPVLEQHAIYRAATASDFFLAFARNVALPWVGRPLLGLVIWAPLAIVLLRAVRRRSTGPEVRLTVLVGVWVLLQAAALAFARGAGGAEPASRYMDMLSLGWLANAIALLTLLPRQADRRSTQAAAVALLVIWTLTSGAGYYGLTETGILRAGVRGTWMVDSAATLRAFLTTGNAAAMAAQPFPTHVPFPDTGQLANAWLRHPFIRQVLPEVLRDPMHLPPPRDPDAAFVPNGFYPTTPPAPRPALGSYTSRGNPTQGTFESGHLTCVTDGYLKLAVAGYLGAPDLSLRLDATGGTVAVAPWRLAQETWRDTTARCPTGRFRIVATDSNPDFWFAFTEPIEIGPLSMLSNAAVLQGTTLLVVGLALAILAARWT